MKLPNELLHLRRVLLGGVLVFGIVANFQSPALMGSAAWSLLLLLVIAYLFDVIYHSIGNPQLASKATILLRLFWKGLNAPPHRNLDNVKGYYTHEQYDWITDVKFPESILHDRRKLAMTEKARVYITNSEVLDLGCGTGLITQVLPGHVTGVDIGLWKLERARQHCPQATFVVDDIEELNNFPQPNQFDVAVCTDVLEHLERPDKALRAVWRVLKPGGILLGTVPTRSLIWKMRRFLTTADSSGEPFHIYYNRKMLKDLLHSYNICEMSRQCLGLEWFFAATKEGTHE